MGVGDAMATTSVNGVSIEYETFGQPRDRAVILVTGLGEQLTSWHPELCHELVASGFFVIRLDNRDSGLSQKFEGTPDLMGALLSGRAPDAPYRLDDMAADTFGVLDALGVDAAHVAGASMGGMIAQTMAITEPRRVLSLTSIMSTTGRADVSRGRPEAYQALLAPAPSPDVEHVVERGLRLWRVLEGSSHKTPDQVREAWLRRDFERSYHPTGILRQFYAIVASGDRTRRLKALDVPTVVLHGADDILIPLAAGEHTAETIQGAELRVIEGWGHDFPLALVGEFAAAITAAADRA